MSHKVTTHWKGGLTFESDNPSGKTVVIETNIDGLEELFRLSPKAKMLSSLDG
jgi:putative redox protein